MSALRPLPSRPSLEFDRKEAKALLRRLKAGDSDAVARARAQHPALDAATASRATLAIAQLVVAREYGFVSWPRLVQYYAGVERQCDSYPTLNAPDFYDGQARSLVASHAKRSLWAGRLLAAYVPQFFGMQVNDVYDRAVTENDARLAIARSSSCPSWEILLERAVNEKRGRSKESEWGMDPWQRAGHAIRNLDLHALQQVVDAHPELLRPSGSDVAMTGTLLHMVLDHEQTRGRDLLRPIVEWLVSQGQDLQRTLNMFLYGKRPLKADEVRTLIDRGADPNWIPPSGIPLLEHMLLQWRNVGAVDVIAAHVKPRDALWIAAGLGDVHGVRRFLDRHGKPTAAARALRPPLDAMGGFSIPVLPDPDDEEILFEAFWVAALNNRIAVMEYMISRGLDVNCRVWGTPVVNVAVGNAWTLVVECLVRAGADLDIHEGNSNGTARDMARTMLVNGSHGPSYRRIVELCGLDPDAILAARDAEPFPVPDIAPTLKIALDLASDDARRQGQLDVRPENLLVGLVRGGGLPLMFFTQSSKMERERFHEAFKERVSPGGALLEQESLPMHPDANGVLNAAIASATARRRDAVTGLHLLYALVSDEHGIAATLLARFGSSATQMREALEKAI